MNKTVTEAIQLVNGIKREVFEINNLDILVCPPFTALAQVAETINESNIALGAQNMHFEASGAYTGEISADMLKEAGCKYVILGHSERRHIFNESDELINKKLQTALKSGLKPILCIGETLDEREASKTLDILKRQLEGGLKGIESDAAGEIVIAYEPVWAIGTGKNATSQQAQEAHAFIRNYIKDLYNEDIALNMIILYGGSVKPANIEELIKEEDVDGALIGGASLKVDSFVEIIRTSSKEAG